MEKTQFAEKIKARTKNLAVSTIMASSKHNSKKYIWSPANSLIQLFSYSII